MNSHPSIVIQLPAVMKLNILLDLTSLMVQKATAHFKIQIGDVTEQDIFTIEKQLK